ncbi:GroES-like protein [Panus rudis PR-1116 ss-1]|nr:GroES-like protein [Panus rudis PR-1116 ss-1]
MSESIPIPTHQKALILPAKFGTYTISEIPVPTPVGPGEVLIRVDAAAINPVDWEIPEWGIIVEKYPAVIGSDAAGVVVKVGEGVTYLKVGDKVFCLARYDDSRKAGFQQYAIAEADTCCKLPSNISIEQAASISACLATSAVVLYGEIWEGGGFGLAPPWHEGGRGKYAGQPIVILGGASSLGQYGIQLAKLSGFLPIITTASKHNTDLLKSLGATHVIDRKLPPSQIVSEIAQITNNTPIKFVYDCISVKETQNLGYDIVAKGGRMIIVLFDEIDKEKKEKEAKEYNMVRAGVIRPSVQRLFEELFKGVGKALIEAGELRPNPIEVLPGGLAAVPEGAQRLKKNLVSGKKLIVRPQETP